MNDLEAHTYLNEVHALTNGSLNDNVGAFVLITCKQSVLNAYNKLITGKPIELTC